MRARQVVGICCRAFFPTQVRLRSLPIIAMLMVVVIACSDLPVVPVAAAATPELGPPVTVGVSFSPLRARGDKLDEFQSFQQILSLFPLVRISAYWNQIQTRQSGSAAEKYDFSQLDWEMQQARARNRQILLTVGIKGIGWPEFYVPDFLLQPLPPDGRPIDENQAIAGAALDFVRVAVLRYRDGYPNLVGWQVENEPLDQISQLHGWSISPAFLAEEVGVVKGLDSRPVAVNAFMHYFNCDVAFHGANHQQAGLDVVHPNDILGVDSYQRTDLMLPFGIRWKCTPLPNWNSTTTGWIGKAGKKGVAAWVTELQGEPWNGSLRPDEMVSSFNQLTGSKGFDHVLLWGVEYWLAECQRGHPEWLIAAKEILKDTTPTSCPG